MMMIGFTGTRAGLPDSQHKRLMDVLSKLTLTSFVHGGAGGADTLAHYAVRKFYPTIPIFVLPANRDCGPIVTMPIYPDRNIILQPRDPLDRNRIIVKVVAGLIATPHLMTEEVRSGTWYTIRRAREKGVPVLIIWPNGTVELEQNTKV